MLRPSGRSMLYLIEIDKLIPFRSVHLKAG